MNTSENNSGTLKFSNPAVKEEETKVLSHIPTDYDIEQWVNQNEVVFGNHLAIDSFTVRDFVTPIRNNSADLLKENQELKALLEPFRKLANSVLTEREVLPSENEWNRPLYSFNFSDITYNDLRRILDHFKSKAQ